MGNEKLRERAALLKATPGREIEGDILARGCDVAEEVYWDLRADHPEWSQPTAELASIVIAAGIVGR